MLANDKEFRCLRPMPETVLMEGDEPLTIEDKPGLTTRPPHRQYKTPRHLLPELERFITEMLEKKWIEPSKSDYSSPVLINPKPNGKGYRFVVDLRQVNDRTKRINYYMPHHGVPKPFRHALIPSTGGITNTEYIRNDKI